MTDATTEFRPHLPLGTGSIIAESFSILFRNLVPIAMVCVGPIFLGLLISGALIGYSAAFGVSEPDFFSANATIMFVISTILQLLVYGIVIASLVQLAYDAKLGRPLRLMEYLKTALATAFPNVILMFVIWVLITLGFMALIIPGIWLYAVYSVIIPALVIERAGFGSMSRSRALTKEYRWPIFGTLLLIGICSGILNFAAVFVSGLIVSAIGTNMIIVVGLIQAVFFAIAYGLSSVCVALIYARLREIKEGVSVDSLVSVFE